MRSAFWSLVFALAAVLVAVSTAPSQDLNGDRGARENDVVLSWNGVLLAADATDHGNSPPDQGGPTRAARAYAIVSVAIFDACNSITHNYRPYLTELKGYERADKRAAISAAAYYTLRALYPQQREAFDDAFDRWLERIGRSDGRSRGLELGRKVAEAILAARADDGSNAPMDYTPTNEPGHHQVDPLNPNQGFLTPQWGKVDTFVLNDAGDFLSPPPPRLRSDEYAEAFEELILFGGDGINSRTIRNREQTEIGIYWAYDGRPGLGTPPRLYNQIARVIAKRKDNTTEENARLLALVNLAQGDAGIQCWLTKYVYDFWRPIVAIRAGDDDGNSQTEGDPEWTPLGAPLTNGPPDAPNFTPPFPAYTSGHATFGAAALRTVANFYGRDDISFSFVSDEFNGINADQNGNVRPVVRRRFDSLSQAYRENAQSRIYLGIHWQFDAQDGIRSGTEIADYITSHALQPRRR